MHSLRFMPKLLDIFNEDKTIHREGTRVVAASTLGLVVELFCFFVQHHTFRIKYCALRQQLVEKV